MLELELLRELKIYVESYTEIKFSLKFKVSESTLPYELQAFIENKKQPSFYQVLFELIDKKGTSDLKVYKDAGIDRRHFSKIRSTPDYKPGKNTVIALSLALELDTKETSKLLGAAGYSLSENSTFDLIIQFCLERKIYDIHEVNQALAYCSLKPLSGSLE